MVGFTIGTGPFLELAERAAETFRQTTGLPCVVIGDDAYKGSGLSYPHHLKYHMFDLVDSETVFYFDADLWWMREWNYRSMLEASDGKLIVVRDLLKSGHILKDARDFEIDVSVYFNSGFMVLHRDTHECMLKAAKGIYAREILSPMYLSNSKFKDQTSLNIAMQLLELPVHFIDRRYNWVQSAGEWIDKGVPVIGAHKIVRDTPGSSIINDFNTFLDKPSPDVKYEVIESAFEELSGAYRYSREGADGQVYTPTSRRYHTRRGYPGAVVVPCHRTRCAQNTRHRTYQRELAGILYIRSLSYGSRKVVRSVESL